MSKHELKQCPSCGKYFECKVGDVAHCQCSAIVLNENDRSFLARVYGDCLCIKCLTKVKKRLLPKA